MFPGLPHLGNEGSQLRVMDGLITNRGKIIYAQTKKLILEIEARVVGFGASAIMFRACVRKDCHLSVFCCHSYRIRKRLIFSIILGVGWRYHLDRYKLNGMCRGPCCPNRKAKSRCCFGCSALQTTYSCLINMKSILELWSPRTKVESNAFSVFTVTKCLSWTIDWKRAWLGWAARAYLGSFMTIC